MEKKKPEIRFNGFEGEWVTTTLGACSKKITTKNNGNEYNIVLTNSAERGIVDQRSYFDREIVNTENIQGYYIVSQDDFVYNPRISMQAPVGPINRSKIEYTGVMSPLYYVFRITDKRFNLTYLEWFFKSSSWHNFMYKNGNSGARSDRFSINDDVFLKLPIYHSKDTSEQEKIGLFLTTLDKLIAKLEAKLDKLRKLKQALLEKMFVNVNGGGYETPEIRFKGYTDKWQVNNVASIFETYYDKNHPNLPVLSASQEFGMVIRDNVGFQVQHNKENEVGYKRVLPGQFVIHLRSFQGGFAHSMVEGITSPAYTVMQFKNSSTQDDIYWKYVLTSKMFIKRLETVTYGIRDGRSISFADFSELDFTFPSLSEQEQIGKCFMQIDTHFNKTSTKLTKLRNIKQSLLQKMFA